MNHMEQSLIHKCFHAQTIPLTCLEHLEQNFQLEPCPHKIDMQLDAMGKTRLDVAPEKLIQTMGLKISKCVIQTN